MLSRGVLAALRFVLLGHLSRGLVRTTDMIRQAGQTRQILRCVLLERSARGSRRTDWLLGAPSGLLRDPNSVDGRRGEVQSSLGLLDGVLTRSGLQCSGPSLLDPADSDSPES